MDVDCRPGLADDLVFGDGDEDFLTYCAVTPPTPEPVAPQPIQPEAPADTADAENAADTADAENAEDAVDMVEVAQAWSWEGFLVTYGVTWSGDDELWEPFRHWFAHHATAQGFDAEATAFLRAMDRQPDRVRAFARYGIPVTRPVDAPRQETDPARCPYDLAAWTGYLDGRGATWDGGAASWPGFRAAFLSGADGLGLVIPATAFVEYVDSQPDRVTVFRRYGLLPAAPVRKPSPHPRTDATPVAEDTPVKAAVPAPRNGRKATARKPAVRNVSGTVKPPRARSSTRRTAA